MKLRPKFDREFLSVTNGQNYVTYGKKFLWNSKKIFPVNYMEMAVTYGEKSFMEQTPGHTAVQQYDTVCAMRCRFNINSICASIYYGWISLTFFKLTIPGNFFIYIWFLFKQIMLQLLHHFHVFKSSE